MIVLKVILIPPPTRVRNVAILALCGGGEYCSAFELVKGVTVPKTENQAPPKSSAGEVWYVEMRYLHLRASNHDRSRKVPSIYSTTYVKVHGWCFDKIPERIEIQPSMRVRRVPRSTTTVEAPYILRLLDTGYFGHEVIKSHRLLHGAQPPPVNASWGGNQHTLQHATPLPL